MLLTGSQEVVPELDDIYRSTVEFEAIFSCIARARDDAVDAVHHAWCAVVVANGGEVLPGQGLQDGKALRPLQGKQRGCVRLIDAQATKVPGLLFHPGKVFVDVGDRKSTRLNSSHANISYA